MIHVTPPQWPPEVVRSSPLADHAGWVKVDNATLQSPDFPNWFSLGDASSPPTSRTGVAIRKQARALVHSLMKVMAGGSAATFKTYDGCSSCQLVTGYGKLVSAELDYDLWPTPSFPFGGEPAAAFRGEPRHLCRRRNAEMGAPRLCGRDVRPGAAVARVTARANDPGVPHTPQPTRTMRRPPQTPTTNPDWGGPRDE